MSDLRAARISPSTGALLLAGTAAALGTVLLAGDMGAGPGTMGMGLFPFLGAWALMMAAMMLPSVSPVAGLYLRRISAEPRASTRTLRTSGLVCGYLLAWTGYGLIAYLLARGGAWVVDHDPDQAPYVAATALALAGLYQLTPMKDFCLRNCRSPVGLFLKYSSLTGRTRDVEVGLRHGGYCVGCCWGLMLVLVVMGVMNVGWMVLIAAAIAIEKLWRHGRLFAYATGVALIALAFVVPSHPNLVPGFDPGTQSSDMNM
jgi:predicted metal-binding membrane protein